MTRKILCILLTLMLAVGMTAVAGAEDLLSRIQEKGEIVIAT